MFGAAKNGQRAAHRGTTLQASLGRHLKDRHVKDAAEDVAGDVAQDVAEDVLGAAEAEDGSVAVIILSVVIF